MFEGAILSYEGNMVPKIHLI